MNSTQPDFQQAWTFLDNLQFFKIKLGLESMRAFLGDLDSPHLTLPFVHIAGTNGKGSTASFLVSMLADAGMRVGLYTSPHLQTVLERFQINGRMIDEHSFAAHAGTIMSILDGRRITYFEFTTALALLWFAAENVDLVILEVGMGGRLDATNVITPLVSVITNVSMDHEQYLGHRLEDVAREKAGIIKPGVPVVSAVTAEGGDRSVTDIVRQTCLDRGSPAFYLGRDFFMKKNNQGLCYAGLSEEYTGRGQRVCDTLTLGLKGAHQYANAAVALATVELLEQHGFAVSTHSIKRGLAAATWPGRLELLTCERKGEKNRVVLDGAHNPAGVKALVKSLQEDFSWKRLILVWGAMVDKDGSSTLPCIAPLASVIFLVAPHGERSARPDELKKALQEPFYSLAQAVESVGDGLLRALDMATEDDLVCVAGSLYLIGEARNFLMDFSV